MTILKSVGVRLCSIYGQKKKIKVGGHLELVFAKSLHKCLIKEKLVLEKGLISFSKATYFDVMFYDELMCGLSQNASWQHSIAKPVRQNLNWSVNNGEKLFVWILNVGWRSQSALNNYQIRMDITLKICAQCYLDYFPWSFGTQKKGSGQKDFVKHAFAFPHSVIDFPSQNRDVQFQIDWGIWRGSNTFVELNVFIPFLLLLQFCNNWSFAIY